MKEKNTGISMAILCSCAIISKHLVVGPQYMVHHNGNAAWIEMLFKCILSAATLFILIFLYKPLFPLSLSGLFSLSFPRGGKTVFSFIYAVGFILLNAGLLRILIDALDTVMAVNAPHEYFALFIITAVYFASYLGINSSKNLCLITFPLVIITLIIVGLILIPHYRLENIMPFLGKGEKALFTSVFSKRFPFMEVIFLLFFAPSLNSYKELKKASVITIITVSVITVSFSFLYCLTIPYPASSNFLLPLYQMTRMIKAGTFLQRLEPLAVFIWTSCILCGMSVLTSSSAFLLSGDEKTRKNALVPIVLIITFFLSLLPANELKSLFIYETLLNYSFILYPLIPAVLIVVARFRKRGVLSS